MSIWELLLISLAMAADAAAVSVSNCLSYSNMRRRHHILVPLTFALFQGIMPLLGYFLTSGIDFGKFAKVIIFAVFAFLGGKMIFESILGTEDKKCALPKYTFSVCIVQGLSTSIDAFAIGIYLSASGTEPFGAAAIISAVTFVLCVAASLVGVRLRSLFGKKSVLIGGLILFALAVKALFN